MFLGHWSRGGFYNTTADDVIKYLDKVHAERNVLVRLAPNE